MIKVANSSNLIKLVNPARMHLNNEEELMVVLKLQDPPSLNVSIDLNEEQKQENLTERPLSPVNVPKKSLTQTPVSEAKKDRKSIKR